ncbi:hypothetical protein [Streptomyces sp. NRRL S-515]|uniref:hypothetical protein n=1 Tax=Streptomyces sp. NRRL S-515 TaxID=1463913 RepID=UPI00068AC7EE|nr:hypothetical protein [Streptomyces sp. NRRL S-515]
MATLSLIALGETSASMWLLLLATFAGGVGNMLVIVGFMVTATTGLPDHEQGMATGLATMTQQVGITMGTPIMSAVGPPWKRPDTGRYHRTPDRAGPLPLPRASLPKVSPPQGT